ncbi:MAG: hypothetical protein IPO10_14200 [Flavobacteriales bacterium]|nr:hypothetical protein [Flavobacteriales bacterium]
MKRTFIALQRALLCLLFAAIGASLFAQEARELVTNTFSWTQVINAQTVEVVPRKRSFGFMIQHRFGAVPPDEQWVTSFLGLDLPANIRFGFQYALTDRLQLEIGRGKYGKTYDLSAKTRILRQTVDKGMPISLTGYFNVATMTDKFPAVGDNRFFGDRVTPFVYRTKHRFSYNTELIVARRFSNVFSAQLAVAAVYRNLVPEGQSNLTMAFPISGRIKVTTKGSILFEYTPVLVGQQVDQLNPVALAYEVATLGHVFQIIVASSPQILEQDLFTTPVTPYDEGYVLLGFNIARTLYVKPKKPRS